jgi:cytochrome b pre-mRNA-processing protein 3
MKGDAMLAAALWRNLMGGKENVDFGQLAQVVGYMRRELKRLEETSMDEVASGRWKFSGDPGDEANLVKAPSRMMKE